MAYNQKSNPTWSYPHRSTATVYNHPAPQTDPLDPPRAFSLKRAVLAAIVSVIFIGLVIGLIYVIFTLSRPDLGPGFSVSSASVSRFNLSSTHQLTADWDIVFSIPKSGDDQCVYYDTCDATVYYGSTLLAKTTLSPFSQCDENEMQVTVHLAALSSDVKDKDAPGLAANRALGSIEFRVRLLFSSVIWIDGWSRSRPQRLKVWCRHVPVEFSSPNTTGSLSGAPKECNVS